MMKVSTARRLLEEAKAGKPHPPEKLAEAKEVWGGYSQAVAAEKAIVDKFVSEAVAKAEADGKNPEGVRRMAAAAREHGSRALRNNRQQAYKERKLGGFRIPQDVNKNGKPIPAVHDPNHSTRLHSEVKQAKPELSSFKHPSNATQQIVDELEKQKPHDVSGSM